MVTILRRSRAAFRFSGPDAQKLLFEVVTGRILAETGPGVWWALLSPQGKVQAEGLCAFSGGAFWLDVDAGGADAFLKRMKLYRLRAAVEIEDLRESHAVGWSDDAGLAGGAADPRAPGLGARVIAPLTEAADWEEDDGELLRRRIAAGIAEIGTDVPADSVFPHDIGMDLLGGVDFKK